jgi:hypothetical protein
MTVTIDFMKSIPLSEFSLERMVRAVEKVRDRLLRSTAALAKANIPYAVVGGNAVATWVSRVDETAVRNTQDVDILLMRTDLDAAKEALSKAGFIYRHVKSIDMFLDGPGAKARDVIHVLYAGEKVRQDDLLPTPDMTEVEETPSYRVVKLEALVRMKLTSFRDKDRMHLRDFLDVGLLDASWVNKVPPALAARLQLLLDTPEG